jgi:hypothetical protein
VEVQLQLMVAQHQHQSRVLSVEVVEAVWEEVLLALIRLVRLVQLIRDTKAVMLH